MVQDAAVTLAVCGNVLNLAVRPVAAAVPTCFALFCSSPGHSDKRRRTYPFHFPPRFPPSQSLAAAIRHTTSNDYSGTGGDEFV